MRKDVKLAFVIGGILIAVLVVYVLVVPGKSANKPVTLDTTPDSTTPLSADKSAPPAGATIADKSAAPARPGDATLATAGNSPTTKPTDPFASKGSDEDKWMLALNRGTVPMMTSSAPPPSVPVLPAFRAKGESAKTQAARTQSAKTQGDSQAATTPPPALMAETSATPDAAAPTTEPSAATAGHTHRVNKGETIAQISAAAYGSQNYWPYIVRANPGIVAEKIRPGMVLNLPDIAEVKGTGSFSNQATSAGATATATNSTDINIKPDTTSPKIDPQSQYEVQSGDSLAKIAMKLYGSSNKWQGIYDLNKDTIGADPAKVKVHSVLKLPEPPTVKQQ